jgi:hypothetical protein
VVDPVFGICKLLPEILYLFVVSSLALSKVQKFIDALYRCAE